jgi:hypothetical protein
MLKKVLSILFLSGTVLQAQYPTAKIAGTVTDASGAAIPGALVTVVNPETGTKSEGRSVARDKLGFGQQGRGTITETVTDPSGAAAVSGVHVAAGHGTAAWALVSALDDVCAQSCPRPTGL